MSDVTGDNDFVSEDSSDHEATVRALQHELEQRKQEVKRLKLEQRARQKEQLRAKELNISQQLHVMMSYTFVGFNCLSCIHTVADPGPRGGQGAMALPKLMTKARVSYTPMT